MAHTGAMIALFPDKQYLGRMAKAAQCMPHAQPIDDLHVTVCYLGTAADLDKAAVIAALQQFRSPVPMPLLLRIRGLDRFSTREDDGTNALYARVICPELHTLRDILIAALDTVGVTVRNDFGSYTPHMTLGYAPEYLPTPNVRIPLITIPVGSIHLHWADDKPMVFPMTGFVAQVKTLRLIALELELLRLKHGKHNQASHGRKGRAGRAGGAAYAAARSGGASHQAALQAGTAATVTERQAIRVENAQRRSERLQTQAERARRAANSGEVTPAQAARLNDKADRLEARARGEKVPPKEKPKTTPVPEVKPNPIQVSGDTEAYARWREDKLRARAELDALNKRKRELEKRKRELNARLARTKEVSGPMATPAHGPGGLFSNPALGGVPVKRRSKSAQRRLGLSTKPFASQAQQRFAFGTGQPWAKRWADETDFSELPAKVKASAGESGSGSASGGGKGYGARAGEVISGNLTRGGNGQFASAGSGGYMPKPPKPAKKPTGGKGAGAKPKKPKEPKAPKFTPEERRAQREAERAAKQAENRAKVIGELGLLEDAAGALEDLRTNGLTADDGGLEKLGLAEQTKDGQYRLTAAGKAVLAAASRGDSAEAKAAMSKGSDRATDQRAAAEEAAAAEDKKKPKGEEKPKGGGGGGGGKGKPVDAADPKDIARIARAGAGGKPPKGAGGSGGSGASAPQAAPLRAGPNREAAVGAMAERVGIGREGLQALRGAAGGGKVNPAAGAALAQAGLAIRTDNGYEATDQGRQALSALERNNTRNWQSALQNAQGRLQREAAAREREETRQKMVRLLALELELLRLKHGKHNQASHGRRTARRRASQAAYAQAKADGLSPVEARAFAREQGLQAQGDRNQRLARMQLKGAVPAPLNAKGIDPAALPVQRFSDPNAADAAMRRQGLVKGSDLSKTEEHTLAWYQGTGHDRINAELRGVIPTRDPYTLDRATSNLDTVMQRSRLKSNVEVHRGMLMDTPEARAVLDRWQPGATFSDPAYVSTTFSRDVAQQFGAGVTPRSDVKTVDVRVRVPAGTPAVYMPTARPNSGVSSGTANEYELLLGRGLNYRVVGRSDDGGRVTVDLEVMP